MSDVISEMGEIVRRDLERERLRVVYGKIDDLGVTRTHRDVLRYVVRFMIRLGCTECYRKHQEIADAVDCCVKTVQRALAEARAKGFFRWRQRSIAWAKGGRRLVSNMYRVVREVWESDCSDKMSEKRLHLLKTKETKAFELKTTESLSAPSVISPALARVMATKKALPSSFRPVGDLWAATNARFDERMRERVG